MEFDWDPVKAASNYQKHGVYFSDAATVFADSNTITIFDEPHSAEEDRFISIGLTQKGLMVVVAFTERTKEGRELIRLISARRADKFEEAVYYGREER